MEIKVRLYASLQRYLPEQSRSQETRLQLQDGLAVSELYEVLRIPPEEIKIVFVNSVITEPEHKLRDRDEVAIFPLIGGG